MLAQRTIEKYDHYFWIMIRDLLKYEYTKIVHPSII